MNASATAQLPPLDPTLAPQVADAEVQWRVDYLRRRLAERPLCGSMRRLTENELREAERELESRGGEK